MDTSLLPIDPEEVSRLYLSGLSRDEVARKLNVLSHRVRSIIEKLGISRSQKEGTKIFSTKYIVNERFFEHIDTLEKCWALGWFYTDGFNRISPPDARISLNEVDEEVLIKLKNLIGSTRPLQYEPKYHRISLIVSRKQFSEDLARQGCMQNKSLIIQYPHAVLDTRAKTCAFLRGALEGDGCIHVSRIASKRGPHVIVSIACASPEFVSALSDIFLIYWGLKGSIVKNKSRPVVGIKFDGARTKVKEMLDEIYSLKTLNLYLERKYQKYQEASVLLEKLIANHYCPRPSVEECSALLPAVSV
jgi:hypothetical protein